LTTTSILGIPVLAVKEVYLLEITPDIARRLLELEIPTNRKSSQSVIDRYARDMAAGKWDWDTNETLAFNPPGQLIDGGNRLRGVIKANVTVKMLVMLNVKTHHGVSWIRRFEQVLRMVFHLDVQKRAVETTKALVALRAKGGMSPVEVHDVYELHSDAINFALSLTASNKKIVTVAPLRAIYARAYYHEEHERIREFAQVMQTGEYNGDRDLAAHAFREQLLHGTISKGIGSVNWRAEIHRRGERALHAFCRYRKLSIIHAASEELYPLPEEGKA
jgi:hypothetical protein